MDGFSMLTVFGILLSGVIAPLASLDAVAARQSRLRTIAGLIALGALLGDEATIGYAPEATERSTSISSLSLMQGTIRDLSHVITTCFGACRGCEGWRTGLDHSSLLVRAIPVFASLKRAVVFRCGAARIPVVRSALPLVGHASDNLAVDAPTGGAVKERPHDRWPTHADPPS